MRFRFVADMHEDYGTLGWRQKSQPGFDPLPGMAVAHDCLEHFRGGDESPANEFEALGAAWHLRGENPMSSSFRTPEEDMAADMPSIVRHIVHEGMHLAEPPRTRPMRDEDTEESFRNVIKYTRVFCLSEMEHEISEGTLTTHELDAILRKALGWLRIGYRRARRRYRGVLGWAQTCFGIILAEADKRLKHANEGDVLDVQVVLSAFKCEVTFREGYECYS